MYKKMLFLVSVLFCKCSSSIYFMHVHAKHALLYTVKSFFLNNFPVK